MNQATLVETVGYGGLVRDRVCAQLAEGSLKANEMLRGVVAYGKQQIANCKLAVGSSVSICVHAPLTYSNLAMDNSMHIRLIRNSAKALRSIAASRPGTAAHFPHDSNRDDFDGASGLPHDLPNVMVRFPCQLNPQMIVRGKDYEPFLHQSAWPRSEILA